MGPFGSRLVALVVASGDADADAAASDTIVLVGSGRRAVAIVVAIAGAALAVQGPVQLLGEAPDPLAEAGDFGVPFLQIPLQHLLLNRTRGLLCRLLEHFP